MDPVIFVIDLRDVNKKTNLKKVLLLITFFEGTYTSFFKDKKSGIRIQIQEDQKQIDPTDPDPQRCFPHFPHSGHILIYTVGFQYLDLFEKNLEFEIDVKYNFRTYHSLDVFPFIAPFAVCLVKKFAKTSRMA